MWVPALFVSRPKVLGLKKVKDCWVKAEKTRAITSYHLLIIC